MKLTKTFLAIGISIIFAIFISYGLTVIYEKPSTSYAESPRGLCKDLIQKNEFGHTTWTTESSEAYNNCLDEKNKESELYNYSRNSFYILNLIGLAAIIGGISLRKLEGIGSGLLGGGILVVLWSLGYTRSYWSEFNEYVKLALLGIVLVVLIYFGYKKIETASNN